MGTRLTQLLALVAGLASCGGITNLATLNPDAAGAVAPMREAAMERDYRQIVDMVRSAVQVRINEGRAPDSKIWPSLEAVFSSTVVVNLDGKLWQYAYTIGLNAQGLEVVSLGDAVAVAASFVPLAGLLTTPATTAAREALVLPDACMREAAGGAIECTLIRSGLSRNGNLYPATVLARDVALFEGVRVFVKSDAEHLKGAGKAVANLLGDITGVRFVESTPGEGSLVGTFRPISVLDPTVTKVREALANGQGHLMGLSIDATAKTKTTQVTVAGKTSRVREATAFKSVNSVDLIVEPGAGGSLDRLAEAAGVGVSDAADSVTLIEGIAMWKEFLLGQIRAKNPVEAAGVSLSTITDEALVRLHEAVCGTATDATRVLEAAGDAPVTQAQLRVLTARGAATARVAASKLPEAAKARLSMDLSATEDATRLTEAAVDALISAEAVYLGQVSPLREAGAARAPFFGAGSIVVGDRKAQTADMLDAFFDPSHKNHRDVRSFRECYVQITGDRRLTGDVEDCDAGAMREAVGSGSFANALGNSMTRRMQGIYLGNTKLDAYKQVVTVGSVGDFRTQERTRIGGYGNLPIVAESGAYAALTTPSDERATYAVAKRGGVETVTLEAIKNDDVAAIRRIPAEMARAAKQTLHEFVFDFFRTNPVIYDTLALYHATHANLFTGALTAAEFALHRVAMVKQVRAGNGKRLNVGPSVVLVPVDLQEAAYNLFVRGQNLDKTYVQSINPMVISIEYWTDTNDWVTCASPDELPVIELSFLDGQEEPTLFVQDLPNVGSLFANDMVTYKIRHIYGGNVLVDGFKATTKAVVP